MTIYDPDRTYNPFYKHVGIKYSSCKQQDVGMSICSHPQRTLFWHRSPTELAIWTVSSVHGYQHGHLQFQPSHFRGVIVWIDINQKTKMAHESRCLKYCSMAHDLGCILFHPHQSSHFTSLVFHLVVDPVSLGSSHQQKWSTWGTFKHIFIGALEIHTCHIADRTQKITYIYIYHPGYSKGLSWKKREMLFFWMWHDSQQLRQIWWHRRKSEWNGTDGDLSVHYFK